MNLVSGHILCTILVSTFLQKIIQLFIAPASKKVAARIEIYFLIIGSYARFFRISACSMVLHSGSEIENTQLSEQTAQESGAYKACTKEILEMNNSL
jgi:hypothetical protein